MNENNNSALGKMPTLVLISQKRKLSSKLRNFLHSIGARVLLRDANKSKNFEIALKSNIDFFQMSFESFVVFEIIVLSAKERSLQKLFLYQFTKKPSPFCEVLKIYDNPNTDLNIRITDSPIRLRSLMLKHNLIKKNIHCFQIGFYETNSRKDFETIQNLLSEIIFLIDSTRVYYENK